MPRSQLRRCIAVTALIMFPAISAARSAEQETFILEGGGLTSLWDSRSGRMLELKYAPVGEKKAPGFFFFERGSGQGGFEVFDELERVLYSDTHTPCRVSGFQATGIGGFSQVKFNKHFEGAPFVIQVTLSADAGGLHLASETVLERLENGRWPRQRNVRVSYVMPARKGLTSWAPGYPEPSRIDENPTRYCYGMEEPGVPRVGIPLYTVYSPSEAGLGIAMPLELPKVQLNLGPEPEDPLPLYVDFSFARTNPAEAKLEYVTQPAAVGPGEAEVIRLTELFVGLTADRPLSFEVWLFSHAPHWRPALRKLVEAYPEYFRINPRMRSIWGSRLGGDVKTGPGELAVHRRFGATTAWLHTHFYRHGEFIPPEAAADPDFAFFCEPYASRYPDNTVRKNRAVIEAFTVNGQGVFLYGFNMHCDTITVVQRRLAADLVRRQDGSVSQSYHDQPVMFFNPGSPYGSHLLRQMDLMLELYPRIMGVGLDNWAYGGIDFGHDDGITMFGNRPAANINFSQQAMIGAIADKWHSSGRLVMVNKARTIESLKGADSMLSEASGSEIFAMFAFMCLDRHLHPNEYRAGGDAVFTEYALKYCLEWGGQLGDGLVSADPGLSEKYYRLIQGLRNRTWVLDPDPLQLPPGTRGNIWRIHESSPWDPGDIVVSVVRPEVKAADRRFREGLKVKVRLPEAGRVSRASWLGVEDGAGPPKACRIAKTESGLVVNLPPVGAAGLLRLEMD